MLDTQFPFEYETKNRATTFLTLSGENNTLREALISQPILKLGRNIMIPSNVKTDENNSDLFFDYGKTHFAGDIEQMNHPLLDLDLITLDRLEPYSIDEWEQLKEVKLIDAKESPFWLQLLKYLSMLFAICLFISSRWLKKLFKISVALFLSLWHFPVSFLSKFNIKVRWGISFLWWSIVTLSLYIIGLLNFDHQTENFFLTFGGLGFVLAWRALVEYFMPSLESYWPKLCKKLFNGPGKKYFFGFIIITALAVIFMMLRLDPFAEGLAVISFYMLVFGLVSETKYYKKGNLKIKTKKVLFNEH